MLDYIVAEVGVVKTVCLVTGTILMILGAQYLSFRETCVNHHFDWRGKLLRTLVSLVVKQEVNYARKIPYMVGAILVATRAAVFI